MNGPYTNIVKNKVVLTEGDNEAGFLPRLLGIIGRNDLNENIQFLSYDGKSKLDSTLITLNTAIESFRSKDQSLGIIIDSDGTPKGFARTLQKAQNALRKIGFPEPPTAVDPVYDNGKRAAIWVMPDNHRLGEFDDLCLDALVDHPLMTCVDNMQECASQTIGLHSKLAKSRLYTILAWVGPPKRLHECSNTFIQQMNASVFDRFINSFLSRL